MKNSEILLNPWLPTGTYHKNLANLGHFCFHGKSFWIGWIHIFQVKILAKFCPKKNTLNVKTHVFFLMHFFEKFNSFLMLPRTLTYLEYHKSLSLSLSLSNPLVDDAIVAICTLTHGGFVDLGIMHFMSLPMLEIGYLTATFSDLKYNQWEERN